MANNSLCAAGLFAFALRDAVVEIWTDSRVGDKPVCNAPVCEKGSGSKGGMESSSSSSSSSRSYISKCAIELL